VARALLGLTLAGLLGFLLLAQKPWSLADGGAFYGPVERSLGDAVVAGLWWAALVNALLCGLLLASARRWTRATPEPDTPLAAPARGRLFWALLLVAALLGLGLRANLARSGFWSDEAWTARYTMVGSYRPLQDDPEHLRLRVPPWRDTLWRYNQPTNQVLYSVLGRLTLAGWQAATSRVPPAFSEPWLRAPALAASTLAVMLAGLLLAEWGLPRAGLAAAFWLAIHPWYVQWGTAGRSYSLAVMFCLLAAWLLTRAVRSGAWRWMLAWGATAFAMLWAHFFSFWMVVTLGASGLVAIAAGAGSRETRGLRANRLFVVTLAAGMLLLQLMAPNFAQLRGWEGVFIRNVPSAHLTTAGVGHALTLASAGIPARLPDVPEAPPGKYPSLATRSPAAYAIPLGVVPLLVALGTLLMWRRGGAPRWLALGLASGLPLGMLVNAINQDQWYPRFALYLVPSVVVLGAAGLDALLAALPWRSARARQLGVAAGLAAGLAGFQLFVWPQTRILLERDLQPSRRAIERMQSEPRAILAGFSRVDGGITLRAYEPRLRAPVNAEEVAALAAEARAAGRPLLLAYAHPDRHRRGHPQVFAWIDDPLLFEEVATYHAVVQPQLVRIVRYTGRPLPDAP
jgi:hypothetical protein